jgi:hypothetical protein
MAKTFNKSCAQVQGLSLARQVKWIILPEGAQND